MTHSRYVCVAMLLVSLAASLVHAQERRNRRELSPEAKAELEQAYQERTERQVDMLVRKVNLDEAQRERVLTSFTAFSEKSRELRTSFGPLGGDPEVRSNLREKMVQARENNDAALMEEVKETIAQMQAEDRARQEEVRIKLIELQKQLRKDIESVLRPEQKDAFNAYWERRYAQRYERHGPNRSPAALKALVDRLPDLSDAQRDQIDQLYARYQETIRDTARDPHAREQARDEMYDNVLKVLTPEQKAQVEEKLQGRAGLREKKKGEAKPSEQAPGQPGA